MLKLRGEKRIADKLRIKDTSYDFDDSIEVLFFNLFLQLERLKYSKWKKQVPLLNAKKYKIS